MVIKNTRPFFRAIFFVFLCQIIFTISCTNDIQSLEAKFSDIDTLNIHIREYEEVKVIISTFLGNFERNYYGDSLPDNLELNWQFDLGTGKTHVGSITKTWSGAGWTGQPLLVREDSSFYLIQNSYDYTLKKINAETGKLVWQYFYDDVLKGTGTIWKNPDETDKFNQFVIIQGSRQGFNNSLSSSVIPSLRAVSYLTGDELWRYNSQKTDSYSRDCDASALILNDTAYIGLEIGLFMAFSPDYKLAGLKDGILQPKVFLTDSLYEKSDISKHGGNLVTESSPSILGDRIYIASGSGHVYGFNLQTKKIDWDFFTGSDIDGSPIVTSDSCILISIEKQYIAGNGGILKLNPAKEPSEAVVWFFPTGNKDFVTWQGGVIGSCGINDSYVKNSDDKCIAAFMGIDGNLYVVNHKEIDSTKTVLGFDNITKYPTPKLVFKTKTGPSISTPIIVENRLLAASYDGLYLYEFDEDFNFNLLDEKIYGAIEATPIAHKGKIYLACRNGNLYCLGK